MLSSPHKGIGISRRKEDDVDGLVIVVAGALGDVRLGWSPLYAFKKLSKWQMRMLMVALPAVNYQMQ